MFRRRLNVIHSHEASDCLRVLQVFVKYYFLGGRGLRLNPSSPSWPWAMIAEWPKGVELFLRNMTALLTYLLLMTANV